jgi:mono/diheme cytochrome c family protein
MDYPVWDLAMGGGLLMALVAIPHVIVAHFAVGGGLLLAVTETLSVRRNDPELRELVKRSSLMLILVSTVFGAISGVGIWVVAGLISPAAISALIHTYVWGWAIEWVFFILEIVAALIYYATWDKISKGAHLLVGWLYFVGAYLSLVIINGIITFMLTPGRWLETNVFWDGFFNPTYWPSLVLRTGIAILMACVFLVFAALRSKSEHRPRIMRYLGWWFVGGALVSYAGYRWWEGVLPDTVTNLFLGAEPLLESLAATRSFTLWSLAVALILGLLALVAAPRLARAGVLVVVALAAFAFFGGYERLREGTRKPFLIHSHMFSNGLLVSDIEAVNEEGLRSRSGWVARAGDDPLEVGRHVFKAQCASCHTMDGYQGIRETLPTVADLAAVVGESGGAAAYAEQCASCHADIAFEEMVEMLPTADEVREDPEMIRELNTGMIGMTLAELYEMGESYASHPTGQMIQTQDFPHPYMPPFVGTFEELEALAAYLASLDQSERLQMARKEGGQ